MGTRLNVRSNIGFGDQLFSVVNIRQVCFGVAGVFALMGYPQSHAAINKTAKVKIATHLESVQHGNHSGRDFLTLKIAEQAVGPISCRGNVLYLDAGPDQKRRDQIEAIAISAVLSDEIVMVVISQNHCVGGKPAFTDLYPVPASL